MGHQRKTHFYFAVSVKISHADAIYEHVAYLIETYGFVEHLLLVGGEDRVGKAFGGER